jgi:hypothetical protein
VNFLGLSELVLWLYNLKRREYVLFYFRHNIKFTGRKNHLHVSLSRGSV